MSKTDITSEKLVYSMGKDKAAADKADNKSTGSRPSSAGAKSRDGGDPYQTKPPGGSDAPYQSGRRVWPD